MRLLLSSADRAQSIDRLAERSYNEGYGVASCATSLPASRKQPTP
jgi:hypothetical protein